MANIFLFCVVTRALLQELYTKQSIRVNLVFWKARGDLEVDAGVQPDTG